MADPAKRAAERARQRQWRLDNVGRQRALVSAWSKSNKARAAQAGGSYTVADIERLWEVQAGHCAYCKDALTGYHVDHCTPLSRGGRNDAANLALACPPCNTRKAKLTADEFMERRG